jgi:RNA polymerase sigma-70 factor (ECF subfamily)
VGPGPFTTTQETALLHRLRDGDEKAFEYLFEGYKRPLYQFINGLVHSEDETEELMHDVFLKVWDNRETIQPDRPLAGFLHTVARNQAFNLLRQRASVRRLHTELPSRVSIPRNPVEDACVATEYEQLAQQAIAQLPPRRQAVYQLCTHEDKTYDEAGHLLGISRDAVKDHMVRARRVLHHFFRQYTDISLLVLLSAKLAAAFGRTFL